jgi:dTDP-4-amino-4,6-dideoxygalactose transaminase
MGNGDRAVNDSRGALFTGGRLALGGGEATIGATPAYIPFNRPWATGEEFGFIREAIANRHLSGNGPFSRRCADLLKERIGSEAALLTHSCTGALEMAALLLGVGPGDEVIMPSFTFASTAGAFALRGATVVFVDVRPDTLTLDVGAAEAAITSRTRAIVPVHYAGVACEMNDLVTLAAEHDLYVVEDAAQAFLAEYRSRPLGSLGHLATLSFHETKNVSCGEGGALLINDARWVAEAEIVQEKGTNRQQFYRGHVDKYTWVGLGSSYAPSEINAAFLYAQLLHADSITDDRLRVWAAYHDGFAELEAAGKLRRPVVPLECRHNAHLYYLLTPDGRSRDALIDLLAERNVNAVFHYVPLHNSPAGRRFGQPGGDLRTTVDVSARLVRLPLWVGMDNAEIGRVVAGVHEALT